MIQKKGKLVSALVLSLVLGIGSMGCIPEHVDLDNYVADTLPEAILEPEANPRDIRIIHVTTDATPDKQYEFRAILEADGSIKMMRYMTIPGDPIDFTMEDLEKGVVTMRRAGRNVITLISKDGDPKKGGTIEMKYIYEAGLLSDTYRSITIEVRPTNGKWSSALVTPKGRAPFNAMFLKKHEKPIIGMVGIAEVIVSSRTDKASQVETE